MIKKHIEDRKEKMKLLADRENLCSEEFDPEGEGSCLVIGIVFFVVLVILITWIIKSQLLG